MKRIITFFIVFTFIFTFSKAFYNIETVNLGFVKFSINGEKCNKVNVEELNYEIMKDKVIEVLNSHNIKYNIKLGLIESHWYKYNNKASKLHISILADECQLQIQFQQKDLENKKLAKMDPYLIKKDIENILLEK